PASLRGRRRPECGWDEIAPKPLHSRRFQIELEALAHDPGKRATHRMRLPARDLLLRLPEIERDDPIGIRSARPNLGVRSSIFGRDSIQLKNNAEPKLYGSCGPQSD